MAAASCCGVHPDRQPPIARTANAARKLSLRIEICHIDIIAELCYGSAFLDRVCDGGCGDHDGGGAALGGWRAVPAARPGGGAYCGRGAMKPPVNSL
jgi:hypothetical protein